MPSAPTRPASPTPSTQRADSAAQGVDHYENFPVASWLCPPHLRPAIVAIYHFARTADDIADEGDANAETRLAQLSAYRQALQTCLDLSQPQLASTWRGVFEPLRRAVLQHRLPAGPLHDLISAFEQDVRHTADARVYASSEELMDYCRLSAQPVGRLLLHLYGVQDPVSLERSDQICSALQLINFWQDIGVDHARQRHYLPADVLARHGVRLADFGTGATPDRATEVRMAQAVAQLCTAARGLMETGAPLALSIPERAGWELRLVVQGGLRILDKIQASGHRSWLVRPTIGLLDAPVLLWRALWMRAEAPQ